MLSECTAHALPSTLRLSPRNPVACSSGLAVYADVAKFPAYEALGLTYHDLCSPAHLGSHDGAQLFHGFWGRCFNDYRDTEPHDGYGIVAGWRDKFFRNTPTATALAAESNGTPGAFFAFTSNVDAHHFASFSELEVQKRTCTIP